MATKKTGTVRQYTMSEEAVAALKLSATHYLAKWWKNNATDEEYADSVARNATAKGAYEFVEQVAMKYKGNSSCVCLPDQLVYDLAGIFFRNGSDGDEFLTADEIEAREKAEADKEKRKAERKAQADKVEEARKAALTPEQRDEEERIEAERKAKSEADAKAKAEAEAVKLAKQKERERQKAIAEEMKNRQMEFSF